MPSKSYSAGHFLLSLDGTHARLDKLAGGSIRGEVAIFRTGSESLPVKRISAVRYEPFRLAVGMGMGQPLYDWIKAALGGAPVAKNGSVALVNAAGKAEAYRHFRDALVQEVTVSRRSTGAARRRPTSRSRSPPSRSPTPPATARSSRPTVNAEAEEVARSNFRFRLTGLEDACKRVATIDSFTVKQNLVEIAAGGSGIRTKHPTTLEIPNLRITFSAADVKPWQDWFDDFVVKGNAGPGNEKSGAIEFLDPSLKVTLGTLESRTVRHLLARLRVSGGSRKAGARYVAELYVQGMQIDLKNV